MRPGVFSFDGSFQGRRWVNFFPIFLFTEVGEVGPISFSFGSCFSFVCVLDPLQVSLVPLSNTRFNLAASVIRPRYFHENYFFVFLWWC